MKYLLLFLITFSIQAETWIITAQNEFHKGYFACHPENEEDGNGCVKFISESEVDKFILDNEKSWGEPERWIHENNMRPELEDRVIDERIVNSASFLTKVKSFIGIRSNIVPHDSYTEYLIKADYVYEKFDITKQIKKIKDDRKKEKEKVENLKKIDIDNMTDQELKSIIKQLIKGLK